MGHRQFGYAQHKLSQIKRIYTDFSLIFYPWKSVKSVLSVFYSALFRQAPRGEFQKRRYETAVKYENHADQPSGYEKCLNVQPSL